MMRYLVMAMRTPAFDASAIEPHREFLNRLRAQNQLELTGGFTDNSGGAYIVRAANLQEAQTLVHADPLHTSGASVLTIHEWDAR